MSRAAAPMTEDKHGRLNGHGFHHGTEVYVKDRQLTVGGRISRVREESVGGTTYRYPVIEAQELHLWPKEVYPPYPPPYYPFYDPWYDPWYPWGYRYPRGTRGGMEIITVAGIATIEGMEPRRKYLVTAMASYRRNQAPTKQEQSPTGECTWKSVDCSVYDPVGLGR